MQIAPDPSLYKLADSCLEVVRAVTGKCGGVVDWGMFSEAWRKVHSTFEVPATCYTPTMTRFLFGIGAAFQPKRISIAGSYVGYGTAWLALGAAMHNAGDIIVMGYDTDSSANEVARRNFKGLHHRVKASFETKDARALASDGPIDALVLDVDDPLSGKSLYSDLIRIAVPHLSHLAIVAAHDACEPKFAMDFIEFERVVRRIPTLKGPYVLPIDQYGISISIKNAA